MKRLVETQTIKSAMNDMSPIQKHTLHRRSRFGAWTTALCMKSGTESLATFYGSLNLLLSAYSQEVLDLKAAWVNCQLVVVDRCYLVSCASAAAQLKHLNNTTLVNLLLIVRIFF